MLDSTLPSSRTGTAQPGLRLILGLCLALLSWTSAPVSSQELKDLARQAKPAVVLLQVLDTFGNEIGSGSGFFVTGDGWIVTNYHVIETAGAVAAQLDNRTVLPVTGVLAFDKANDLAVVKVEGFGHPTLPLARTSLDTEVGERVVVLGGPLGLASTLSEGIVSAVREPGDPALEQLTVTPNSVLQITASTSPGSSGSPVINPRGEAIGVVFSQVIVGQNLNFAIPIEAVHDLLASIDPEKPAVAFTRNPLSGSGNFVKNAVASLVFFALAILGYRRLMR